MFTLTSKCYPMPYLCHVILSPCHLQTLCKFKIAFCPTAEYCRCLFHSRITDRPLVALPPREGVVETLRSLEKLTASVGARHSCRPHCCRALSGGMSQAFKRSLSSETSSQSDEPQNSEASSPQNEHFTQDFLQKWCVKSSKRVCLLKF